MTFSCRIINMDRLIIYNMNRLSINEDLKIIHSKDSQKMIVINFKKVIEKQAQLIKSLQEEILLLKSYLSIQAGYFQGKKLPSHSLDETIDKDRQNMTKIEKHEAFVLKIGQILDLKNQKNIDQAIILSAVQELKEQLTRKSSPIFVQRVKEIKVPITIQKIIQKPVDKIVQKIVYIQKPTVVFKQKIIQKFIERKEEVLLNTSFSQKTLKIQRQEDKEQSKFPYKNRQSNYRKEQIGNNFIKKRDYQGKYYGSRKDYYDKPY